MGNVTLIKISELSVVELRDVACCCDENKKKPSYSSWLADKRSRFGTRPALEVFDIPALIHKFPRVSLFFHTITFVISDTDDIYTRN